MLGGASIFWKIQLRNMNILFSLLLIILMVSSFPCFAESDDAEYHWYTGFSVMIGSAYRTIEFEVDDPQTRDGGILAEKGEWLPIGYFSSPYFYFGDTTSNSSAFSFGWYVNAGYSFFDLHQQKIEGYNSESDRYVDMGTSVNGRLFYALPIFFLNFGKQSHAKLKGFSAKIGYGIGLAHVKASGDIIVNNSGEKHDINVNSYGLATGYLFEARYNNLALRAQAVWPSINNGPYEYGLTDWHFTFGYVHTF